MSSRPARATQNKNRQTKKQKNLPSFPINMLFQFCLICVYVNYMSLSVPQMFKTPWRPEESVRSSGSGVLGWAAVWVLRPIPMSSVQAVSSLNSGLSAQIFFSLI